MRYGRDHGYLFVDHGASPGIPEWMARQAGYDPALVREGKRYETKTMCCAHCKTHVVPAPTRKLERAHCPKCSYHYICDACAFLASQPDYVHTPFEQKVDMALSGQPQPLGSPPKLLITP
jgi:hypothetical protein